MTQKAKIEALAVFAQGVTTLPPELLLLILEMSGICRFGRRSAAFTINVGDRASSKTRRRVPSRRRNGAQAPL